MIVRRVWPSRPTFDNPYTEYESLRREMGRLLGAFAEQGPVEGAATAGVFPPVNVTQDRECFYVRAEVPGVEADKLSISALRNRLSLSGTREIPKEQRVSYHRKERAEGSFNRTLTLPAEVDANKVEARYANGVLTIVLPKAEAAKPRQIHVTKQSEKAS